MESELSIPTKSIERLTFPALWESNEWALFLMALDISLDAAYMQNAMHASNARDSQARGLEKLPLGGATISNKTITLAPNRTNMSLS
eukprot:scaffold432958_cov42-Prasinocladus_malaysianus.AAC.1